MCVRATAVRLDQNVKTFADVDGDAICLNRFYGLAITFNNRHWMMIKLQLQGICRRGVDDAKPDGFAFFNHERL